ncbi:Bax inhibitor 1-related [Arabidopsis thaliana x Arabidopsis arenosa]|uniref:Bax inhibitor 1-related n=1 Tax=Arabidopsis thaliana x Arabidopsis arenosa TaxID=1240361 RepID=A0A8T1Y5S3_9BRAS|nr:Bax inhibitor 1-related [Arabidopsis thaliana x Arabidopsis arenosa]
MEANGTIWSHDSLRNFHEFTPAVQNHLKRVYLTLFCALIASAFGAYFHMVWNIGGNVTTLGFTGTMIWLRFTPSHEQQSKRLFLLYLSALLKGASVGPMIMLVIDFDSSVLVTAFVGTAVVFVCFSAAAMLATRSITVVKFELYFGLLIFVGYIVVVMIIEKAHHGDMDYVQHSFTFFTDFASLFVRILVLNMFRKMKKGRKDRRK